VAKPKPFKDINVYSVAGYTTPDSKRKNRYKHWLILGLKKNERIKTMGISGSNMEVLFLLRPYFVGIFPYIALT
jgi:hypothetical protein